MHVYVYITLLNPQYAHMYVKDRKQKCHIYKYDYIYIYILYIIMCCTCKEANQQNHVSIYMYINLSGYILYVGSDVYMYIYQSKLYIYI